MKNGKLKNYGFIFLGLVMHNDLVYDISYRNKS